MVKVEELQCWKCGTSLDYLILPLSRRAECKSCEAKLHVCRMCEFYNPSVAKQCREPVAEEVKEKTKPNFCDYLQLTTNTYQESDNKPPGSNQAELNALFGLDSDDDSVPANNDADKSRQALDELFGINDSSEKGD